MIEWNHNHKFHALFLDMSITVPPLTERYEFTPIASIVAFAIIGILFLIALIGRCLALNRTSIANSQGLDLMIYRAPPKTSISQQKLRSLLEVQEASDNVSLTPVPIHRGPKNL